MKYINNRKNENFELKNLIYVVYKILKILNAVELDEMRLGWDGFSLNRATNGRKAGMRNVGNLCGSNPKRI